SRLFLKDFYYCVVFTRAYVPAQRHTTTPSSGLGGGVSPRLCLIPRQPGSNDGRGQFCVPSSVILA
uniref:Ovule protein n=1 Tax=Mesocestoides corti TaxID=53468 RepID=A0A5K3FI41_MESCO